MGRSATTYNTGALEEGLLNRAPSTGSLLRQDSIPDDDASEERALLIRRIQDPEWRIDRGAGYYAHEREKYNRPCLVQVGKHGGRSRVKVAGISMWRVWEHKFKRDFFNSAVNASLHSILLTLAAVYFGSIFFWGTMYYVLWSVDETCFTGVDGIITSLLFAVETQQTIGYGVRAPGECWLGFWFVSVHSLLTVVLDSIILGIAFARISHPKNRGRTILISNSACIARRDGELKFMFRVADIQLRPVSCPQVRAYLFTWGPDMAGTVTAEGERQPFLVQELPLAGVDATMLLPLTLEHTIDERSPLAGQTQKSLEAVGAEVVVVFTAVTELGVNFTLRQSYLPSEIHWGHVFASVVEPAHGGSSQHSINIAKFHDVEPQPGLDMIPPHRLAAKVMSAGDRGALPAPQRGTNTLVLSEVGVIGARDGRHMLMFRVGDVYPGGQVLDVHVSAYLYRYQPVTTPEGELLPFSVHRIHLTPATPCLRFPCTVVHPLDHHNSPVAAWRNAAAKRMDSEAEVLVVVQGTCAATGRPVVRQRVYPVLAGIRWGAMFLPMQGQPTPGLSARKAGALINWAVFHATAPAQMDAAGTVSQPASRQGSMHRIASWSASGAAPPQPAATTTSTAPAGQIQLATTAKSAFRSDALQPPPPTAYPASLVPPPPGTPVDAPPAALHTDPSVAGSLSAWTSGGVSAQDGSSLSAAVHRAAAAATTAQPTPGSSSRHGPQRGTHHEVSFADQFATPASTAVTTSAAASPEPQDVGAGSAGSSRHAPGGAGGLSRQSSAVGLNRLGGATSTVTTVSSTGAAWPSTRQWPYRSGENTASQATEEAGSGGTTERRQADWTQKRSLFVAMEEMARHFAEEEAARKQQQQ